MKLDVEMDENCVLVVFKTRGNLHPKRGSKKGDSNGAAAMSENMHKMREIPVGSKFKLNPRGRFWSFFCYRQTVQVNTLKPGGVHVENAILDEHRRVIFRNNGMGNVAFKPNGTRTFTENLGKKLLYRYVRE